jgi:putative endonuclease
MALDTFVVERNLDVEVRFDIIAFTVVKKEWSMNHIEDASYPF